MHLLYPCDPLQMKRPDEQYAAEHRAMRDAGFGASVVSLEMLDAGVSQVSPPIPTAATVLYRGWMRAPSEYEALLALIGSYDARPLTDLITYLATHYLPNWYPLIADLTPETHVFPPDAYLEAELRRLGWAEFFVKDYVKSLKTSVGSRLTRPEQAATLVAEMRRVRGTVEGGFCVRRVEDFRPETERRYFVWRSQPYSPDGGEAPHTVWECARRIASPFFSVDVVQRSDGVLRVVEIGDGQVSDLVGWTTEAFVRILMA